MLNRIHHPFVIQAVVGNYRGGYDSLGSKKYGERPGGQPLKRKKAKGVMPSGHRDPDTGTWPTGQGNSTLNHSEDLEAFTHSLYTFCRF